MKTRKIFIVLPTLIVIALLTVFAAVSCNRKTGPTESDVLQYFQDNKDTLVQLKDQLKDILEDRLKDNRYASDYLVSIDNDTLFFDGMASKNPLFMRMNDLMTYDLVAKVSEFADIEVSFDQSGEFAMVLTVLSLKDGVWYGVYFAEDEGFKPPIHPDYFRELEDNWYFYYKGLV